MFRFAAQMVIHLALQFLVDGFPQLADVAVRLPTDSGKPGVLYSRKERKYKTSLCSSLSSSTMWEIKDQRSGCASHKGSQTGCPESFRPSAAGT